MKIVIRRRLFVEVGSGREDSFRLIRVSVWFCTAKAQICKGVWFLCVKEAEICGEDCVISNRVFFPCETGREKTLFFFNIINKIRLSLCVMHMDSELCYM